MHFYVKSLIFVQIVWINDMKSSVGRLFLQAVAAVCLPFMTVSCHSGGYVTITGYAQGGSYLVKVDTQGTDVPPEDIKDGIDSILVAFDNSLSGYNPSSLLTRFNAGETIRPDSTFIGIYRLSRHFYDMTDGAFDVSAAPLFDMWGFGFTSDSLPGPAEVEAVLRYIGMRRLVPDLADALSPSGTLDGADAVADGNPAHRPHLNYNAIAQGYSCDLVAGYLESLGITSMLVDIGGEIVCSGYNPAGKPWTIGVDRPYDGNDVSGADLKGVLEAGPERCGVVTSGNYRKFYVVDGRKYAHTIDPRTGYPVSHSLLSATIVADDAATADALATYCMVIGFEKAAEFIGSRQDLEGYLIYDDGGEMRTWKSPGFRLVRE